jgi:hypothetical protein
MKKFFMTVAIALGCVAANAQTNGYIGGEVQLWRNASHGANETTFSIAPEVGFNIADDLAIGANIGYAYHFNHDAAVAVKTNAFVIKPYARYTCVKMGNFSLLTDFGVGFATYKNKFGDADATDAACAYEIGIRPGICYSFNNKWCAVAHVGFLGYRDCNDKTYKIGNAAQTEVETIDTNPLGSNGFGFSLDNSLSLSLYYNF